MPVKQEAALTCESEPVDKNSEPVDKEDVPLEGRKSMAFMGTTVMYGVGVAVGTEIETGLGKIANRIGTVESTKTPL